MGEKHEKATFASGCFWCGEAIFEELEGVVSEDNILKSMPGRCDSSQSEQTEAVSGSEYLVSGMESAPASPSIQDTQYEIQNTASTSFEAIPSPTPESTSSPSAEPIP